MSHLTINGEKKEYTANEFPATVSELLRGMNIAEATVVAEVDGEIIERVSFATTRLKSGQTVELIRFVGGG